MHAILEEILNHVRSAWRFRWIGMIAAWGICLIGWTATLFLPDTYEAAARVFVDTRTTLSEATKGMTVDSTVDTQIQRIRQALLSAPKLAQVAHATGLDAGVATPQQRQKMIDSMRSHIYISGGLYGGSAGVYTISFHGRDRQRGLLVVKKLLDTFVAGALGGNRQGSLEAQQFLQGQISDYEKRLSAAEERLAQFKKTNVGLMPGTQGDYFSHLQGEMDAADKAEGSLRVALQRRDEIERQLHGEQPLLPGAPASAAAGAGIGADTDTASRIRDVQQRLDDLLLRFTDKHPDVIALRATLAELKARQQAQIEAARKGDEGAAVLSGLSANPVYQSVQLQLNQVDVDIAALRGELADHQHKIAELRKLVNTAPEVEAEFKRLNRDYDVTRTEYQALVERLDRTRFSQQADETGIVRFEIIDPPSSPFLPVAPNRPMLIVAVLVVGLGACAALAYLLHLLKPVFTTPQQLGAITGLPVLGVVSTIWLDDRRAQFHRAMLTYAGTAASLILLACAVLLVHSRAVQLVRHLMA